MALYKGCVGLHLRTQAERDAIAIPLLKEADTPIARANLGTLYLKERAGLDLPSQEERDVEAKKLFLASGTDDARSQLNWMLMKGRLRKPTDCVVM